MLAIGRALMGNPTLLILDEPSEGLSPLMVKTLIEAIRQIQREGVTLLIADQNVKFARVVAAAATSWRRGISAIPASSKSCGRTSRYSGGTWRCDSVVCVVIPQQG